MATVYADTPAQAFGVNADLDQRRVVNYLNSIQQNRQAQMQSYGAWQQQAQAQQQEQQQEQAQMIALVERLAQQRAQDAARETGSNQFLESLKFNREQLAEMVRHNKELETKPNASKEALDFRKLVFDEQTKQEDDYSQHIADLLEKRRSLQGMLAQIPADAAGREALVKGATGEGMEPEPQTFGQGLGNVLTFGALSGKSAEIRKKWAEVKQKITGIVSDLPVDFSKAQSIADYATIAKKAIDDRIFQIPDFKSDVGTRVTQDEKGRWIPILHGKNRTANPQVGQRPLPGTPPALDPEAGLAGVAASVSAGAAPVTVPPDFVPGSRGTMFNAPPGYDPGTATATNVAAPPASTPDAPQPPIPQQLWFETKEAVIAANPPRGTKFMLWDVKKRDFVRMQIKL